MSESDLGFLAELEAIIAARASAPTEQSYTARLVAEGERRIAQKLGEEAVELALAAVSGERDEQLEEAADLVYHLLVLLHVKGADLGEVVGVLRRRHSN